MPLSLQRCSALVFSGTALWLCRRWCQQLTCTVTLVNPFCHTQAFTGFHRHFAFWIYKTSSDFVIRGNKNGIIRFDITNELNCGINTNDFLRGTRSLRGLEVRTFGSHVVASLLNHKHAPEGFVIAEPAALRSCRLQCLHAKSQQQLELIKSIESQQVPFRKGNKSVSRSRVCCTTLTTKLALELEIADSFPVDKWEHTSMHNLRSSVTWVRQVVLDSQHVCPLHRRRC